MNYAAVIRVRGEIVAHAMVDEKGFVIATFNVDKPQVKKEKEKK